ncbi:MAG: DUF2914 domain-containing protein [Calditrichaeota bacterium]|nr:DUF2914 domain-containing protein [Calditrichota bacterium]
MKRGILHLFGVIVTGWLLISGLSTGLAKSPRLVLFPGIRSMGMGYAYTATAGDNLAIFWNPAGLSFNPQNQWSLESIAFVESFQVRMYPRHLLLSFSSRGNGNWVLGGYSMGKRPEKTLMAIGHSRRLNRFLRLGGTVFYRLSFKQPEYQPDRWGGAAGIMIQPNPHLRLGGVLHTTARQLWSGRWQASDNLLLARTGIMWKPRSFLIISGDYDLIRKQYYTGIEIQPARSIAIRAGAFGHASFRDIQQKRWEKLYFTGGISLGNPGLEIGILQQSPDNYYYAIGFQVNFGKIRQQIRLPTDVYELAMAQIAGLHLLETPNPQAHLPAEISYRLQKEESLTAVLSTYASILDPEIITDTLDILAYNEVADRKSFQSGTTIRLPLRNWLKGNPTQRRFIQQLWEGAIDAYPHHWPTYQQLGLLWAVQRNVYKAQSYLRMSRRLAPYRLETLASMGLFHLLQGDAQQAREIFLDALMMDSTHTYLWAGLGQAQLQNGQIPQAISSFLHAIRRKWIPVGALYYLAESYYQHYQYAMADTLWKQLIQTAPNHPYSLLAQMRLASTYRPGRQIEFAENPTPEGIRLIDGGTARHVQRGSFHIRGAATTFPDTVGRVYVWLKLTGVPPEGIRVVPEWYWKDQLIFRGEKGLRVGISGRTFGYKTILKHQTGPWRVDIYVKGSQHYLGTIHFTILPTTSDSSGNSLAGSD